MKLKTLLTKVVTAIIATFLGSALGVLVRNVPVLAQSDQKKVRLEGRKTLNDQLKFSELEVGRTTKRFEQEFSESKGWIGRTSFRIENVSDKDIIYLSLKILFPETKTSGNIMAYSFSFGNRPGSRIQNSKPFTFSKNESMTIDLADQYQRISNFLASRTSVDDIDEIELEAGFIVFADGTAWGAGAFMRQDPNDPTRWVQVDAPGYNPIKTPGGKPTL